MEGHHKSLNQTLKIVKQQQTIYRILSSIVALDPLCKIDIVYTFDKELIMTNINETQPVCLILSSKKKYGFSTDITIYFH